MVRHIDCGLTYGNLACQAADSLELPSIFRLPTGGFYAACFS
jgi:hypothetical protein